MAGTAAYVAQVGQRVRTVPCLLLPGRSNPVQDYGLLSTVLGCETIRSICVIFHFYSQRASTLAM